MKDICAPNLTNESELNLNEGYFLGYSPERINPSDKEHLVTSILKVTSCSTVEIADYVEKLYKSIIIAGTFKVAEAAKVIENTEHEINYDTIIIAVAHNQFKEIDSKK